MTYKKKAEQITEEIMGNIFDRICLAPNPLDLQPLSNHSYLADFYLRQLAEKNPEYVPYVRKRLAGLL